jgi:glutamate dehydrogenase (NAD(P)+)
MAWMMDAFSATHGYSPAIVTGKPLDLGGAPGREAATGRGCVYVLDAYCHHHEIDLQAQRVAIQGFGNVGLNLARLLDAEGCRVVAVSDSVGGLHDADGLDVASVVAHKTEHGSLEGFRGAEAITNEELILLDCDVLAPCALEQVITEDNAAKVRAAIVCEGGNGPVTPAADEILEDRGVLVLPDVLANAGGVVVSYFEWVQGLQEYFWREDEVNAKLNDIVVRAFEETWATRERFSTSMRMAAYGLAVQRVAEATTTRGLYP